MNGRQILKKDGIRITQMRLLPCTLHSGEVFGKDAATVVPHDPAHLPAIWCFCRSPEFHAAVRRIDQKLNVTNATLVKVPFNLERWQQVAAEEYPDGLPAPHSDDPTQRLFKGHPKGSTDPLQVAVARLVGYRWPDQEPDDLDALADADGIVPLSAVRGEPAAAERLRDPLRAAYGDEWSADREHQLLTEAGAGPGVTLDDWLRHAFFEAHCKRFHQRPFVWHLWDGRRDGFARLVNYHELTHKALENLAHSYLQDWINLQAGDAKAGRAGADLRLGAAQQPQEKLKRILVGEPPYDVFVRWKPLSEQAIGWEPDLNDGVRMNIRPFIKAEVLRKAPNIKWTKDRGNEPERDAAEFPRFRDASGKPSGERVNDVHLTIREKQAARQRKAVG